MTDEWEIKGSVPVSSTDAVLEAMTLGFASSPREYTVKNTETGETRTVIAYGDDGVGQTIAEGQFND